MKKFNGYLVAIFLILLYFMVAIGVVPGEIGIWIFVAACIIHEIRACIIHEIRKNKNG